MDTRQTLTQFILAHNIIAFHEEPLTLKSGRQSHVYINWRHATCDAFLLDELTNILCHHIQKSDIPCDTVFGVPEGASKTAIITQLKLAKASRKFAEGSHVVSMGRAHPKLHGDIKDRFFIGAPRGNTWVIEDTVTTGGSLLKTIEQLRESGITVAAVLALTDRGAQNLPAALAAASPQTPYFALTLGKQLVTEALKVQGNQLSPSTLAAIAAEFNL